MPAANNVQQAYDWTLQGANQSPAQANGNGLAVNVGGLTWVTLQVVGSFTASIYPEGTLDDVTWPTPGLFCVNLGTGAVQTSITAPGLYLVPVAGCDQFRARIGGYLSGNITVTAKGGSGASPFTIVAGAAGGTPLPANVSQVGGAAVGLGQAAAAASLPVVLASNQSSVPVTGPQDTTATVNLAALNGAAQIATQGVQSIGVQLGGTWTATLTPEVSADGGTTWMATQFYHPDTQTFTATIAAAGQYLIVGTGGMSHARVRASAYTSGTITGTLRGSGQADDVFTAQISPVGQLLKAASIPVVIAQDQGVAAPAQYTNPAGGTGPLAPLLTNSDAQLQAALKTNELLHELLDVCKAALSP